MRGFVLYFVAATGALLTWSVQANAKTPSWPSETDNCSASHFHVNDLVSYAEMKEQRLSPASTESINPRENGSIRVHGWNQSNVLVKACVQAAAPSESEAQALASQVPSRKGRDRSSRMVPRPTINATGASLMKFGFPLPRT